MPKEGFKSITVPDAIYDDIMRAFTSRKEYYRDMGIKSLSQFLNHHFDKALERDKLNMRFTQIKQDVTDSLLVHDDEKSRVFEVILFDDRAHCLGCNSMACVHVGFAMSMPELWGADL